MEKKISPSVMCVDFFTLADSIKAFEENGIELLHVDIMDGSFVPNYTLGTDFVKALKEKTRIPLDIHCMIEAPENKLGWFPFGEGDYVSIHAEATRHLHKAVTMIKERGARAMVAINPATPLSAIEEIVGDIDAVLVMTVNPGFAGQKLVGATLDKIARLRRYLDERGHADVEIEVDGNVSFENAEKMNRAGANIFVAGTSSIFKKGATLKENIEKLRLAIR